MDVTDSAMMIIVLLPIVAFILFVVGTVLESIDFWLNGKVMEKYKDFFQ